MRFFKSKEKTVQENQSEKERLLALTEKELMVEMILKLNEVSKKCDDISRKIVIWSD